MSQEHKIPDNDQKRGRSNLVESILAQFEQDHGIDLRQDPIALERLEEAAAQAVNELKSQPSAEINLPYLAGDSSGPINWVQEITREDLESEPGSAVGRQASQPPVSRQSVKIPQRSAVITQSLMVISIGIYLLQMATQFLLGQDLPAGLGVKENTLILQGQYWRLLTPMVLHGSLIHLGFNMYALYILGRRLERYFGHYRFLSLYLISGLAGNILSFLLTPAPSLGSSTAIFGILGAEGVFIYQHRHLFGDHFKVALRQIVQIAVINIIIGLSPGIDNWGHIGGLVGGIVFTWFAGPAWKLEGLSPHLELVDQRSEQTTTGVFVILGILLTFLAGAIIILRRTG